MGRLSKKGFYSGKLFWRLGLAGSIVLAAGVVIYLFFRAGVITKTPLKYRIEQALGACYSRKKSRQNYVCLKNHLGPLLSAGNSGEVIRSLEEIYAPPAKTFNYGTLTCHGPAHLVGELLAGGKKPDFTRLLASCTTGCDYGCIHGAFIGYMRQDPQIYDRPDDFCRRYAGGQEVKKELTSCQHIVGHGLAELYGNDLSSMLGKCDQFAADEAKKECGRGVVMDLLLGSTTRDAAVGVNGDQLLAFCEQLPATYRPRCFGELGFYAYSLLSDKSQAAGVCGRVPENWRTSCYSSLGGRLYLSEKDRPGAAREFCEQLDEKLRPDCIRGVIEININEGPDPVYSVNLCREQLVMSAGDCLEYLGVRYEWAYGVEKQKLFCRKLKDSEQSACLAGKN